MRILSKLFAKFSNILFLLLLGLTILLIILLKNANAKLEDLNSRISSNLVYPINNNDITDQEIEPDNTIDEASPLRPGILTVANLSSSGDKDFYRINVINPTNLVVTLKNLPKKYELDIYNPDLQMIGKSVREGFLSTSSAINADKPGKYYLEIIPQYGDSNQAVPYSIEIDATSKK